MIYLIKKQTKYVPSKNDIINNDYLTFDEKVKLLKRNKYSTDNLGIHYECGCDRTYSNDDYYLDVYKVRVTKERVPVRVLNWY
jgi:DNA-directed RNA polymerase subunit N (RpoN/RPB10)